MLQLVNEWLQYSVGFFKRYDSISWNPLCMRRLVAATKQTVQKPPGRLVAGDIISGFSSGMDISLLGFYASFERHEEPLNLRLIFA